MCGIAGIIQSDLSQYSKVHLKKMTDALAHRGPDGEGLWQNGNGNVLLGHRRLSIIDLSDSGNQPMHFPAIPHLIPYPSPLRGEGGSSRYTIVHNGEIYNYLELKEELKKKGYNFRSQTDTEVIVAAYDYWQDECVDYFDGMFAFAIWDEKEKELFAARDRFGEKPFFYYFDGKQLLFASEMKSLWAAGIERIPNQKMLFNFITIGYTDHPSQPGETFFENISKLPAATTLSYNTRKNELILEKYWDIDPEKQDKKITDREAEEKFIHFFTTSIKRRLRSDVSVGTSLSGGLDSSSVISAIYELQNSALPAVQGINTTQTFTACFPGFEKDELEFSKKITEKFNLRQSIVNVSGDEMMKDWEKLCYHQEEPFGSASIYGQYKVYELAKQHDVKVLLDGQGADETLAGYHKYYKWYWQELFRNRKLFRSKELKAAVEMGISEKFGFRNIIAAYFPGFATVTLENQYLLKAIRQEDLTKDFVKLQSKEAYYTTPDHFTLNGVLHFNTCTHGLEELLRYADRNSMAHGREVRLPFLSHELVEFIFSLPAHFKIRNGWTKWLLRETMENSLPTEITWRKDKVGFEPPQKNWMENKTVQEGIREARKKLVNENILKPEVLQKPIQPKASHDADNYDWRYFSAALLFK